VLTEWYQAFPYTGTTVAINDIKFVNEDIHRYDLDLQSTVSIVAREEATFDSWQVKDFALCYSIQTSSWTQPASDPM
jgi:hypothetical protein